MILVSALNCPAQATGPIAPSNSGGSDSSTSGTGSTGGSTANGSGPSSTGGTRNAPPAGSISPNSPNSGSTIQSPGYPHSMAPATPPTGTNSLTPSGN